MSGAASRDSTAPYAQWGPGGELEVCDSAHMCILCVLLWVVRTDNVWYDDLPVSISQASVGICTED